MLTLKQSLFGIFLLDILTKRKGYCDQFLCVESDKKTFGQARNICQAHNMTLPVLETREEYQDFWNFLSTTEPHDMEELWLGLQWNDQDGGFYQWLNGNILGIKNWAISEPKPQIEQRCVYAAIEYQMFWYTAFCSTVKNVICFYEGYRYAQPNPTIMANFSTAYEMCRDSGGRLPVIVTPADHNLLVLTGYNNFWLGLEEHDDQFVWITGKKLESYYWYGNGLGGDVHAHQATPYPYITMEAEAYGDTEHFCCQKKTTENDDVNLWSRNYFRLVERNAIPLASPRSEVMVRSRAQCAMACSRDDGCFKYTVSGTICRTYGNVDYFVSQKGRLLFQKVRNW